jgi:uncharacterized cupin superfamily protein
MTKESKVFRPTDLPKTNSSSYPEPFRGRSARVSTDAWATRRGSRTTAVNLIRVLPGGQSPARHAHSKQDEFVSVIEG